MITLFIQTQEEHDQCDTMPSVSEAADKTGEIETEKAMFLVSALIILGK